MFYLPLSREAAAELHILESWIMQLDRDPTLPDVWIWSGQSGGYTAKSFYRIMHSHLPTIQPCKWLSQSKCTMKIKVFVWLLFFDRLNTKDMLVRRHWRSNQDENLCLICSELAYENRIHLFLTAPSAVESGTIWVLIGLEAQIFCNVSCTPGPTSHTLSSLKLY